MSDFKKLIKEYSYLNRFKIFQNLMRYRVREILLVSSLYDSFILEEEGQLYEMILSQYQTMNLSQAPSITQVSSAKEALKMAKEQKRFDLIITTPNIMDMSVVDFAQKVVKLGMEIPVVLLTYDNRELTDLATHYDITVFVKTFIWQGDHRILISIIKYIEDKMNVDYDTEKAGVQSLILIEDNVHFYSSFMPIIYSELLKHSQSLMSESVNTSHRILRMRARPKILLCGTYEEALDYYTRFEKHILGVISDIEFPSNSCPPEEAGIEFAKKVKESNFDIPVLLQSDSEKFKDIAHEIGASFCLKTSPTLLRDLREFMSTSLSFDDFIFRLPDGSEVDRAHDLRSLEKKLHTIPDESILYHAERNHFSNWFKARTEFWLAHKLRPRRVTDYESTDQMRKDLINSLHTFRREQYLGSISDFNPDSFDTNSGFARIGSGSLGGKARGLGFANSLINSFKVSEKYKGYSIFVPPSVVLGSDVFDQFLEQNHLRDFAIQSDNDKEIIDKFVDAPFPIVYKEQLRSFLSLIRYPIAVRSSSLLEDSRYLPFAGIYETYMLPNNHHEPNIRLDELLTAIKKVFASTFCRHAKDYIKSTPYRLEEEKMAVIIQKLVGARHKDRFYPSFSGVVRSHNFYPLPPMKTSDGIAAVGLGLGRTVVEGRGAIRFCPRYPKHLNQFSTVEDTLKYSQKDFYAVQFEDPDDKPDYNQVMELVQFDLDVSEEDGVLSFVGSTYSPENDTISDGTSRDGIRLVTFAPILKHKLMPLPEMLDLLMEMGSWGMSTPVEIEFAVNLSTPPGVPKEFGFLQIRPLVKSHEAEELEVDDFDKEDLICQSPQVLGNGRIDEIYDIVFVDKSKYDRSKSRDVAEEIHQYNIQMTNNQTPYLLIGVGRWGSSDPWLGIPVTWDEISKARVIVETSFKDFSVTPSQGTHFFQNITSFRVGYFTVNDTENDFIDWAWLKKRKAVSKMKYVKHIRFKTPVEIRMNGHSNKGVILKPKRYRKKKTSNE